MEIVDEQLKVMSDYLFYLYWGQQFEVGCGTVS